MTRNRPHDSLETQETIGQWANATFGGSGDNLSSRHCIRLLEEVVELCLSAGSTPNEIRFSAIGTLEGYLADYDSLLFPDKWNHHYSDPAKVPEEMADCEIVLRVLAHRRDVDLQSEVDKKMKINRSRKWNLNNDGTGYHVKEGQ